MATRIDALPLEELYDRPKITPAVAKQILLKEDFTKIQPVFCDKVCTLPACNKEPGKQSVAKDPVDILIVYPTRSPPEKYRTGGQMDDQYKKVVKALADELFQGLKWDFTYAMRCRPTESKTTVTAIRKCVPYLLEEVRQRSPAIVLGLGVDVGKALGLPKVPRGLPKRVVGLGEAFNLICTVNPKILSMIRQNASGDFWGPDYLDLLRFDLKKAAQVARGEVEIKDILTAVTEVANTRIVVATSLEDVSKFAGYILNKVKADGEVLISWDTETTSLDPWKEDARFLCHQFGFKDNDGVARSFVVPLWHRKNTAYNPDLAWDIIKTLLEHPRIVKVTHNGAFDMIYTRVTKGVEVKSVLYDTMLLLHSRNSGMQGCYGLKDATCDWLFELQLGGYEDLMSIEDEESDNEAEELAEA